MPFPVNFQIQEFLKAYAWEDLFEISKLPVRIGLRGSFKEVKMYSKEYSKSCSICSLYPRGKRNHRGSSAFLLYRGQACEYAQVPIIFSHSPCSGMLKMIITSLKKNDILSVT